MKRVHAHFANLVQGVGFRHTAIRMAKRAGVTGSGRNTPDGVASPDKGCGPQGTLGS